MSMTLREGWAERHRRWLREWQQRGTQAAARRRRQAERLRIRDLEPWDAAKCGCGHPPYPAPCSYCSSGEYLPP